MKFKIMSGLILSLCVIGSFSSYQDVYATPVNANIILDGTVLKTNSQFQNINGRILVPFREIGEAMHGSVNWDPATQKITIYKRDTYSIMHIGQTSIQYGNFTMNSLGEISFTTTNESILDVPPQIIDNLTYIPVRGLGEALGAEVVWNSDTSTAVVTSPPIKSNGDNTCNNSNSISNSLNQQNYNNFGNTSYFKDISSRQAKSRYQDSNSNPFILVVYNRENEDSKKIVPNIQDVASDSSYRIYGLDMSTNKNNTQENVWLWSYIRQNNFQDPTILYVYSKNKVESSIRPTDMDKLKVDFKKFKTLSETSVEYGDFKSTTYFKNINAKDLYDANKRGQEFMFVLYDSTDDNSKLYVPIIKAAAAENKKNIYAVDIDSNPNYENYLNFVSDINYTSSNLPVLYLVYNDRDKKDKLNINSYTSPSSVAEVTTYINDFTKNSSNSSGNYGMISDAKYITDLSQKEAYNKFNNNNSYIILVYDSSDSNKEDTIKEIIRATDYEKEDIYSVDYNYDNSNIDSKYTKWLDKVRKYDKPVLLYIDDSKIDRYQEIKNKNNAYSDTRDFIDRYNNNRNNNSRNNYLRDINYSKAEDMFNNSNSSYVILVYDSYYSKSDYDSNIVSNINDACYDLGKTIYSVDYNDKSSSYNNDWTNAIKRYDKPVLLYIQNGRIKEYSEIKNENNAYRETKNFVDKYYDKRSYNRNDYLNDISYSDSINMFNKTSYSDYIILVYNSSYSNSDYDSDIVSDVNDACYDLEKTIYSVDYNDKSYNYNDNWTSAIEKYYKPVLIHVKNNRIIKYKELSYTNSYNDAEKFINNNR